MKDRKKKEHEERVGIEESLTAQGEGIAEQEETSTLEQSLEDKTRELDELGARLLRLQADFDNFRRRTRIEKEEASQIISNSIMAKFLPVADNFERALASGAQQDSAQLLTGVELVYRQFMQLLESCGVKSVVAVGAQFDPNLHEAVMRVEDSDQPDGMVVEEFQKGYEANAKLLRPSMVKVVSNN